MGKMDDLMKAAGFQHRRSMGAGDSPRIAMRHPRLRLAGRWCVKAKDVAMIPLDRIVRDENQPRKNSMKKP